MKTDEGEGDAVDGFVGDEVSALVGVAEWGDTERGEGFTGVGDDGGAMIVAVIVGKGNEVESGGGNDSGDSGSGVEGESGGFDVLLVLDSAFEVCDSEVCLGDEGGDAGERVVEAFFEGGGFDASGEHDVAGEEEVGGWEGGWAIDDYVLGELGDGRDRKE